jgi:hypothetical protein
VNGDVRERRVHIDGENAFVMKNVNGEIYRRKLTKKQVDKIKRGEFIGGLFGGMRTQRNMIANHSKQRGGGSTRTYLKSIQKYI